MKYARLVFVIGMSVLCAGVSLSGPLPDSLLTPRADSMAVAPTPPSDSAIVLPAPLAAPAKDSVKSAAPRPADTSAPIKRSILVSIPAQSVGDILSAMPGVVNANGSLHVRGGLADELVYFIDGVPATDPYSGKLAVAVPPHMINDISLTTGNLPARFGGTMSGVVELTTIQPGARIGGGLKWTNDLLTGSRRDNQWEVSLSGPLPMLKDITVGLSAQVRNGDDVRPCFMPDKFYVRDPSHDVPGYWADTLRYSGADWDAASHGFIHQWMDSSDAKWEAEKQQRLRDNTLRGWKPWDKPYLPNSEFNDYYISGSIGYALPQGYGTLILTDLASRQQHGEYDALWKYNLDGYGAVLDRSNLFSASWQDQLKPFLRVSARYTRMNTRHQRGLLDTAAERDRGWWQDYAFFSGDIARFYMPMWRPSGRGNNPFGFLGNSSFHYIEDDSFSDINRSRITANTWLSEALINAGPQTITIGASTQHTVLSKTDQYLFARWYSSSYHITSYDLDQHRNSFYINDELTLGRWMLAPGLKMDMASLSGITTELSPAWPFPEQSLFDEEIDVNARALSSRLSARYDLSTKTSLRAGYEELRELPSLENLTNWMQVSWQQWPYLLMKVSPFFVFQKTVQYSAGIDHRFPFGLDISAAVFKRTLDPIVQFQMVLDTLNAWTWYYNLPQPYGRSRGLELEANWDHGIVSIYLNYSFEKSVAGRDFNGTALDYDLRHKMSQIMKFSLPQHCGPSIGSFRPFANTTIDLANNVASGFPYSRLNSRGRLVGEENGSRTPWSWTTDLVISKEFNYRLLACSFGIEVTNLFNRKNLSGVFPVTGAANDDGSLLTIDQLYPTNDSIPQFISTSIDTGMGSNHGSYTYRTPNPYYSPYADANGSGAIDRYERYAAYVNAWHDLMSDPYNSTRTPFERAYLQPRLIKLSFGIRF